MLSFLINLYTSKDISDYYTNIAYMVRYSDYSLTEIENMIPYEFRIYSIILTKQLKEEKQKRKNG